MINKSNDLQYANGGGYLNNTTYKLKKIYRKIIKAKKSIQREYSYLLRPFIILCVIYFIALLPLILAHYNYIDDVSRVYNGYPGFHFFSRWIAEYGIRYFHTSNYIFDISPLSQLFGIIVLSIASCMIIHLFCNDKKKKYILMISVIPLGLSPYFMECFSYKYDSLFMAISILSMIIPFVFVQKESWKTYAFVSFLGTLSMCMTYQAASGIYPIIVVFLAFRWWRENKNLKLILKLVLISTISYAIGILVFKYFIMTPINMYSGSTIWPLSQIISGSVHNIMTYFKYIISDFRMLWLILVGIIVVFFVIFTTWNSNQNKLVTFVLSIVTLALTCILSYGLYIFLQSPLFAPRAMYGFGVFIALIALQTCEIEKGYFVKFICVILSWCFIVYASCYGNVLNEQKRYTDFRIQMVLSDLNNLEVMTNGQEKILKLLGTIGRSPVIENMPKYGVLQRTLPDTFSGTGWTWSSYYFLHFFKIPDIKYNWNEPLEKMNLPILKDTMYHKISGNDEYILIELK